MRNGQAAHGDKERIAAFCAGLDFSKGACLGHSNQGEVRRFKAGELDLAIKTPSGAGPLKWLRRQSLLREWRTYRQLTGVEGFAPCHGLFEHRFLVLDYIDGEDFRRERLKDPEPFFADLLRSIQAMHARGVAHGDLKRKSNLRIDRSGQPVILDLGTAVLRRASGGWVNRRLFEFARQTDLNAWVKLKYGGYADVSEADRCYLKRSRLERALGRLRSLMDRQSLAQRHNKR